MPKTDNKKHHRADIEIIEYSSEYQKQFAALNIEWIQQHWEMEEADYLALDDPEAYILNSDGFIYLALYRGEVVGTCALLNHGDDVFELAKMAVTEKAKGKSIGYLLGKVIVDKALSLEPKRLYLESNTVLKPAINLYKKLGFVEFKSDVSPYERCNIQMEIKVGS